MKRVVVTGSSGLLGGTVVNAWRESGAYDAVGVSRGEGEFTDIVADTGDVDGLVKAFAGADAVVHFAGSAAVTSSWEDVLQNNIIGLRNVFEAARIAGVKRVIFASSNHAVGTFEMANAPELYAMDDGLCIDHTSEIMPDSLYGVSKAYGEALARYYVDHHHMQAVCLRIGGCPPEDAPTHPQNLWQADRDDEPGIRNGRERMRAVWLSLPDCVHLVERSLEADVEFAIVYGISDNPRKIWDIDHAREVLGYSPQDAAPREIFPDRSQS